MGLFPPRTINHEFDLEFIDSAVNRKLWHLRRITSIAAIQDPDIYLEELWARRVIDENDLAVARKNVGDLRIRMRIGYPLFCGIGLIGLVLMLPRNPLAAMLALSGLAVMSFPTWTKQKTRLAAGRSRRDSLLRKAGINPESVARP